MEGFGRQWQRELVGGAEEGVPDGAQLGDGGVLVDLGSVQHLVHLPEVQQALQHGQFPQALQEPHEQRQLLVLQRHRLRGRGRHQREQQGNAGGGGEPGEDRGHVWVQQAVEEPVEEERAGQLLHAAGDDPVPDRLREQRGHERRAVRVRRRRVAQQQRHRLGRVGGQPRGRTQRRVSGSVGELGGVHVLEETRDQLQLQEARDVTVPQSQNERARQILQQRLHLSESG